MTLLTLRALADGLDGEIVGDQVAAPGPGHSRRDRSMWIKPCTTAPDGFLGGSFAGQDWREIKDYVRQRLGLSRALPAWQPPVDRAPRSATSKSDDVERARRALTLWDAARDPRGTIVERYLASRGLELPDEAAGAAIRFHPDCPFAGQRTPAMICLVRDVLTDAPVAIHRTALMPDGRKAVIEGKSRAALGPIAGGVIKLSPDETVETRLGLGEGVETTLSLRHTPYGAGPVWAAISAGGVARFPVLPGLDGLWLAVDHDPAGRAAADEAKRRYLSAEVEVVFVMSDRAGADLNNEVSAA